jgi:hypothetical protein
MALAAAATAGVIVSSRGAGEKPDLPQEAVRVADRFVQARVADGRRRPHGSLSIDVVHEDVSAWPTFLEREGNEAVERGGEVQEACEVPCPSFAPERRLTRDCVVYQVRVRINARPTGPAVITARMRVWPVFRRGAWRVAEVDFTPRNGFRSTSKRFT